MATESSAEAIQSINSAPDRAASIALLQAQFKEIRSARALVGSKKTDRSGLPSLPNAGQSGTSALDDLAAYQKSLQADFETRGAALKELGAKLTDLNTLAERAKMGSAVQGTAATVKATGVSVSDANFLTATAASGTQVGSYQVAITQLANPGIGQQAQFTVNGQQFTSATNTVENAGGISGLTLNLLQVTPTTSTTTSTTTTTPVGSPINVSSYDRDHDKIKITSTAGFTNGDELRFSSAFAGLDPNTSYYVRVKDGDEMYLYSSKATAIAGGTPGLIDVAPGQSGGGVSVSGITVSEVSTTTTTTTTTTPNPVTVTVSEQQQNASSPGNPAIRKFLEGVRDVFNYLDTATGKEGALASESSVSSLAARLRRALGSELPGFGNGAQNQTSQIALDFDVSKVENALQRGFGVGAVGYQLAATSVATRIQSAISPFIDAKPTAMNPISWMETRPAPADAQLSKEDEKRLRILEKLQSNTTALLGVKRQSSFLSSAL